MVHESLLLSRSVQPVKWLSQSPSQENLPLYTTYSQLNPIAQCTSLRFIVISYFCFIPGISTGRVSAGLPDQIYVYVSCILSDIHLQSMRFELFEFIAVQRKRADAGEEVNFFSTFSFWLKRVVQICVQRNEWPCDVFVRYEKLIPCKIWIGTFDSVRANKAAAVYKYDVVQHFLFQNWAPNTLLIF